MPSKEPNRKSWKKGLKRLLNDVVEGRIGRLVITHKDRLLRFGAELVFAICAVKNVEVVVLNQGEDTTFEEDLAQDVLEIITVFSARLYGSRSRKNEELLDGVKTAGAIAVMLIAHKIPLDLNNAQASYLARAAGTARFAIPTGCWRSGGISTKHGRPTIASPNPHKRFCTARLNAIKAEQFPWMLEVTKNAPQMAIVQLGEAFRNFFAGRARYPQFRKKRPSPC